jgi:hypothetical protein
LSLWIAIVPCLLTIFLIYYYLIKFSCLLHKRSAIGFVAFLVFLAPFAFVLTQVRNLLELMWVLLLTPFYSVLVMSILFSNWILRYYCLAFATLALVQYFLGTRRTQPMTQNRVWGYEVFWNRIKGRNMSAATFKPKLERLVGKWRLGLGRGIARRWSLIVAVVLLATLATTLVSSTSVRNPTYQEALQFVASDKTDQHQYIVNSYTCVNFATDFRNNALKAGYECGYAIIFFPDNSSHELNCFNTTDRGLIFVEPQLGEVTTITIGKTYCGTAGTIPPINSTVVRYCINW